eukprot:GHVP01029764.1.p1 GENE.GHVP01029764.1~~GHVP01029764.1.p1  ORF type:complete len:437 (+),score=74.72 GHVP01029764.1:1898-3208(+)
MCLKKKFRFDGDPLPLTLKTRQGLQLKAFEWTPPADIKPIGVIAGFHGIDSHTRLSWLHKPKSPEVVPKCGEDWNFGESVFKGSWIENFVNLGYIFLGIDFQSHGESDGINGKQSSFRNFDDLAQYDVFEFLISVKKRYPSLPLHAAGTSMGACALARGLQIPESEYFKTGSSPFLQEVYEPSNGFKKAPYEETTTDGTITEPSSFEPSSIDQREEKLHSETIDEFMAKSGPLRLRSVIFLGGMFSLKSAEENSPLKYVSGLLKIVAKVAPNTIVIPKSEEHVYPYLKVYYDKDPICYKGGIRARTLDEILKASRRVQQEGQKISDSDVSGGFVVESAFFLHNRLDGTCDAVGSIELFEKIKVKQKKMILVNINDNSEEGSNFRINLTDSQAKEFTDPRMERGINVFHSFISDPGEAEIFTLVEEWLSNSQVTDAA